MVEEVMTAVEEEPVVWMESAVVEVVAEVVGTEVVVERHGMTFGMRGTGRPVGEPGRKVRLGRSDVAEEVPIEVEGEKVVARAVSIGVESEPAGGEVLREVGWIRLKTTRNEDSLILEPRRVRRTFVSAC